MAQDAIWMYDSVCPRNHVLDGMEIPKGNEQFLGVICPPKTLCVTSLVYAAKTSIMAPMRLLHLTALLLTGRCHVDFLGEKSSPI